MSEMSEFPSTYEGLRLLAERLRGPEGCPWDRQQTPQSLRPLLLEECYELVEALDQEDPAAVAEELGDVLFHVVMQVRMAEEAGLFDEAQVTGGIIRKLVNRHPHVFGDAGAVGAGEVVANWEEMKRAERSRRGGSMLDGVPRSMPALSYARSVQGRAARLGFDWDDFSGVLDKLVEEIAEVDGAESDEERENEMGDVLFSVVNAARWMGVDPEAALRRAASSSASCRSRRRRRCGRRRSASYERQTTPKRRSSAASETATRPAAAIVAMGGPYASASVPASRLPAGKSPHVTM